LERAAAAEAAEVPSESPAAPLPGSRALDAAGGRQIVR
jgi:hypothetical protein